MITTDHSTFPINSLTVTKRDIHFVFSMEPCNFLNGCWLIKSVPCMNKSDHITRSGIYTLIQRIVDSFILT